MAEMERRRIFMTADALGGVWQYSRELAGRYARQGLHVDLVLLGPPASPARRAEARDMAGVDLIETGLPLDWTAEDEATVRLAAEELARLAARRRADLVHLNCAGLGCAGAWPAPLVTTLHSCVATWWQAVKGSQAVPPDFVWRRELVREALQRAAAVIVPSRAFAAAVASVYGDTTQPFVVHNGRGAGTPRRLAAGESEAVFACGRLWDEAKNAAVIDRAAALLDSPIRAAGSTAAPGRAPVALPHLELLGELDDRAIGRELRRTGIYVSVALYEPYGLSVLEAALHGCALVLSEMATFRELWDGAACFVDPNNSEQVAREIGRLRASPNLRAEMGRRARERAMSFTGARMAANTQKVYRRALNGAAGARAA